MCPRPAGDSIQRHALVKGRSDCLIGVEKCVYVQDNLANISGGLCKNLDKLPVGSVGVEDNIRPINRTEARLDFVNDFIEAFYHKPFGVYLIWHFLLLDHAAFFYGAEIVRSVSP